LFTHKHRDSLAVAACTITTAHAALPGVCRPQASGWVPRTLDPVQRSPTAVRAILAGFGGCRRQAALTGRDHKVKHHRQPGLVQPGAKYPGGCQLTPCRRRLPGAMLAAVKLAQCGLPLLASSAARQSHSQHCCQTVAATDRGLQRSRIGAGLGQAVVLSQ
jgi:hypothetical protein